MKIKKYDKLIRDKTPQIYFKKGIIPEVRNARNDKEFCIYLRKKILEEALEVVEKQDINKLKEEISDLVEVTDCLIRTLGISRKEIKEIKKLKDKKRGGFNKRLILIKTKENKQN